MSETSGAGENERTGLVPDQFDDLGATVEIDLYTHFAEWLDDPHAQIAVSGLPPGIVFDQARMMLRGEFGRDTLFDEAYEVRVEVRSGDRVLMRTMFRWTVRDRQDRSQVLPARPTTAPLSSRDSGAGSALLFSLGAQAALLASSRPVRAEAVGVDGARAAFAPQPGAPVPDGGGLRSVAPQPVGNDLAITGSVEEGGGNQDDDAAGPTGLSRLRSAPPREKRADTEATQGPVALPPADEAEELGGNAPPPVDGPVNSPPAIDPLPTMAQIEDAPILNIDVIANAFDRDGDPITVRSVRAENGTVVIDENGDLDYLSVQDFVGTDQITYVLDDGRGGQTTGKITIAISPVNDAPVAVNDQETTFEDRAVLLSPLANDTDVDAGDTRTIVSATSTDGTVTIVGDQLQYRPAADTNGLQTISYTIEDSGGLRSTATVTVDVKPVNDAPVAKPDDASTGEDAGTISFSVVGNDTDIEGSVDPASVQLAGTSGPGDPVQVPGIGRWTVGTDGTIGFTPERDWNGTATMDYTVADPEGLRSAPATVTVVVSPVNDAPVPGSPLPALVAEDAQATFDVLSAASDAEGDAISVVSATSANGATVAVAPDGAIVYRGRPDANGLDVITYVLEDANGAQTVASLEVDVQPVNDAPTALDDAGTGTEDTPLRIDVVSNDTDPDAGDAVDPATVALVGAAPDGTFAVAGEGVWVPDGTGGLVFTPEANFNGTTSAVEYTVADMGGLRSGPASVSATIGAVNDAPTLVLRGFAAGPTAAATWTHNDVLDPLKGEIADASAISAVRPVVPGAGLVASTPYQRLDLEGAEAATLADALSAGDLLDFGFTPTVGGEPAALRFVTASDGGDFQMAVFVSNDGGATFTEVVRDFRPPIPTAAAHDEQRGTVYLNTHSIDLSGSTLAAGQDHVVRVVVYDARPHGTAASGELYLDDIVLEVRPDTPDYGVRFGETGTVNASGPVALAPANGVETTDADGNIVSIGVEVTGLRDGGNEFLRIAFDGGTVAIDLGASGSYGGFVAGGAYAIDVTSAEGEATIAVSSGGTARDGPWVSAFLQAIEYDNASRGATEGVRSFSFQITDADGAVSATRTTSVSVSVLNDAAEGTGPGAQTVDEDQALSGIDPLSGLSDPEGDALSVVAGSLSASDGTATLEPDGTLSFTPDANFNGIATVTYDVTDANGATTPVSFEITVDPVNDAPVVTDDAGAGRNTAPITVDLSDNLSDVDHPGLTTESLRFADGSTLVSQPNVGTWELDTATGIVTFTPDITFVGPATVSFTASDGTATSAPATITATVADGNEAPTAIEVSGLGGTAVNQSGNAGVFTIADADALFAGRTALRFEASFSLDGAANQSYAPLLSYAVGSFDEVEFGIETGNGPAYLALEISGVRVNVFGVEALLDGSSHGLAIEWDVSGAWAVSIDGVPLQSGTGLGAGVPLVGGGTGVIGQEQDAGAFDTNKVLSGFLERIAISDGGGVLADWRFGDSGLAGPTGTVPDVAGSHDLVVGQVGQAGFTASPLFDAFTIGEDAGAGTVVATLSTLDPNPGNTHTYSLASPDPFFEIVGDEIRLRADTALDHETEPLRTLSVVTTDQGGLTHTRDVTVHIANRNEAPTALDGAVFGRGVAFNEDGGTAGHFGSADADVLLGGLTSFTFEASFLWSGTETVTLASYQLAPGGDEIGISLQAGPDGQTFRLEIGQAQITVPTNTRFLNDGARHQVAVTWDGATGLSQFFVDGAPVASGPTLQAGYALAGGGAWTVGHDRDSAGIDDAGDAFNGALYNVRMFSDVRSEAQIAAGQGVHVDDPALLLDYRFDDFDGTNVANGAGGGGDLTFAQSPILASTVASAVAGIAEDASAGTVVMDLSLLDPDRGDAHTFALVNDPTGGAFAVVDDALVVADASLLDADAGPLHTVTLEATDRLGLSTGPRDFAIRVEASASNTAPQDIARDAFLSGVMLNASGGNAAHYTLADPSTLVAGWNDFSIDVSFAAEPPASVTNTSYTLFHSSDGAGNDQVNVAIVELASGPVVYVEIASFAHTFTTYDASALLDGAAHTISVNWENGGGTLELFVDGTAVATANGIASGLTLDATGGGFSIGQELDPAPDPAEAFTGTLFGVRVFTETRSTADIAAQWNRDIDPATPGLGADWQFGGDDPSNVANNAAVGSAADALRLENVTGPGFVPGTAIAVTGVSASAPTGAVVMSLQAIDTDAGDTHTFSLTDPTGTFAMNGNDVVVAPGAMLDPSAGPVSVNVTVTDLAGGSRTETFSIQVLDRRVAGEAQFQVGTPQADTITATATGTVFYARGADDTATGSSGDDALHGQGGADVLTGGAGDDVLHGDRSAHNGDAVGPSAQVNTTTPGNQSPPVAVALEDGRSLLVWYGDAYGASGPGSVPVARFVADDGSPIGAEFLIGTLPLELDGKAGLPPLSVERLSDGNVLVTWRIDDASSTGGTNDFATVVVNAATGTVSAETQLQAASGQALSGPVVVPLQAGGAFLVWHHDPGPGETETVAGHRLDPTGKPIGPVVLLGGSQLREDDAFDLPLLSAADLGNGRILVGWSAEATPDRITGIVHDTASGTTGAEFVLAQASVAAASPPLITSLVGGGAFVAWYANATAETGADMLPMGQFVDAAGAPVGGAFALGTTPIEGLGGQPLPPLQVAALSDGGVHVAWRTDRDGPAVANDAIQGAVVGVRVGPDGTVGAQTTINDHDLGSPSAARVVELEDGRLLAVSLRDADDPAGPPSNLVARLLDTDGVPLGGEFLVSTTSVDLSAGIDVDAFQATLTVDGDVLVSFSSQPSAALDGDGSGVFVVLISTAALGGADTLTGGEGEDLLVGDGQTYATDVHELGPVAFWRFEGATPDGVDHSGNGHLAVVRGAPATARGLTADGTAAALDGTDDHYVIAADPAFDLAAGTITGWFMLDASGGRTIVSRSSNDPMAGSQLEISTTADDRLVARMQHGDGTPDTVLSSTATVTPGTVHHFAFSFGAAGAALYLDGALLSGTTTAFDLVFPGQDWIIGASAAGSAPGDASTPSNFFAGVIDEIAIVPNVLPAWQIGALHAARDDEAQAHADRLFGGADDDVLLGGGGDDQLDGGSGADVLDGGAGFDTVDYSGQTEGVDVVLAATDASGFGDGAYVSAAPGGRGGEAEGDVYSSIERVVTTGFNDRVYGATAGTSAELGAGDDLFDNDETATGRDEVSAGAGDDVVRTGGGDDTLDGGDGADRLFGEAGDDILRGGAGDDLLDGGAGGDFLDGGAGTDVVDYSASVSGVDILLEATTATDDLQGAYASEAAGGYRGEALGDTWTAVERFLLSEADDGVYGLSTGNTIELRGGNDRFDVADASTGADTIRAGAGDDSVRVEGGNDTVYGEAGNDALFGGAGNDALYGGAGDDLLDGGAGDDLLQGGEGADAFTGGAGTDTVSYRNATAGIDALFSDTDAGGIAGTGYFVTGAGGRSGEATGDTYNGIERVEGSAFADRIYGADSGMAADLGAGDDIYDVGNAIASVDVVDGGAGADLIYGGRGNDVFDGGDGDDELHGDGDNDTLRGGAGSDRIVDGAGDDIARGGTGDDLFIAGAGADAYFGDDGFDTLDFSGSSGGVDIILSDTDEFGLGGDYANTAAGGQTGDAAGDRYASIEQIITTRFNDRVYGSEGGVRVDLGAGDDVFDNTRVGPDAGDLTSSNDGNDTVYAGSGDDRLNGGYGNDRLFGEEGNDIIVAGDGEDEVEGGAGDDRLFGGAGTDTGVFKGNVADYDVRDNGDGTITVTDLRAGSPEGTDILSGFEILRFADTGAVAVSDVTDQTVTGTPDADVLVTGDGNDTVYGLAGTDTITTGAGDDTIYAGSNDDTIRAGSGHDLVDGGSGTNTLELSGLPADYTIYRNPDGSYALIDERPDAPDGTAHLIGIDDLRFGDGTVFKPSDVEVAAPPFTIVGDGNNNTIVGTAGDDLINGAEGLDTIDAGAGNDIVYGRADADTITGGAGNDYIVGGSDGDTAVYSGNLADYSIHKNSNSTYTITDLRPGSPDGRDVITGVKFAQFADVTVEPKDHEVVSPVALDLDGSGLIETTGETTARDRAGASLGETVAFDMDGDGDLEAIEWLSGTGDGLLVDNGDGRALADMNGTRLFGDQGGRFSDGYEQLALRDADGDGRIAGNETAGLAIWVDDGDAAAEEGELFTLADFGIESVSVQTHEVADAAGRTLVRSQAETTDGRTVMTEDVWFGVEDDEALRLRPSEEDQRPLEDVA